VRASGKVTTTCVRCVRPCAKTRGPISATQPANRLQPRASIEFSSLAVFHPAVLQTCKPGTHLSHFLAFTHRPALTRHSARLPTLPSANRKPCKPCFLVGRWRTPALSPPVLEYRQEGPVLPGACKRAPTIRIGDDHHHRHNHHRHGPDVTVVMVVTVAPYCLHRRKHRYALGTIITQDA